MERKILKTLEEVECFFKNFGKSFSVDTETTSLKYTELEIEGISFCDGNKACYINLIDNHYQQDILQFLKTIFEGANTIVAHNIVYDMKVLHKYGISLEGKKIYDTMIADHLIDENRQHGLKYLAETLLGKETTKYEEAEKAGHTSDIFYEYAINDAVWTWELCMMQQPIMKEQMLVWLFREIEMPFQFVLLDMEINGVLVDVDKVEQIREDLKKAIDNFILEMHSELGEKCSIQVDLDNNMKVVPTLDFNSTVVLQDILFNRLGLEVVETTKKGAKMTGKSTIQRYRKEVKFVELLEKYKIATKLLNSYFSPDGQILSNLEKDGRVRASILDFGTVTGRLSMRSPALQTLPKPNDNFPVPSRSAFTAGPGRKMFTVDFSNQEGRVTAHLSGDKTYIRQLEEGWDAHLATANAAFNLGIPEEELSINHPNYKKHVKKHKTARTKAKSINFALPYGGTEFAISKAMGCSKEEALDAINKYYGKYSGIKQAMDKAKEELNKTGYLTTMFGRKRHFIKYYNKYTDREDYPDKAYRQAFNFLVQSASADMMRKALIDTRTLFNEHPEWDAKILLTVHDEGVFSCKEEYLDEASDATKEVFEKCVKLIVRVISDVGKGDNYEESK
jgi:DNA polymerase-1